MEKIDYLYPTALEQIKAAVNGGIIPSNDENRDGRVKDVRYLSPIALEQIKDACGGGSDKKTWEQEVKHILVTKNPTLGESGVTLSSDPDDFAFVDQSKMERTITDGIVAYNFNDGVPSGWSLWGCIYIFFEEEPSISDYVGKTFSNGFIPMGISESGGNTFVVSPDSFGGIDVTAGTDIGLMSIMTYPHKYKGETVVFMPVGSI